MLIGIILGLIFIGAESQKPLVIESDTTWVVTNEDLSSNAYFLALRDLKQDWYARLGKPPIVLTSLPNPNSMVFNPSPVVVILGSLPALKKEYPDIYFKLGIQIKGAEQHFCKALPYDPQLKFTPLVCGGADSLGSIFALYEFSHSVLGVDPMRYWVEKYIETQSSVLVEPNYSFDSGVPFFRHRGFFINDEDQLGGWAQDPMGQKVFTLQMWDMVYQTILRLKGNAVIVGTAAYPDEQSFELAARRGLYLAQHHITLLGVNIFNWPEGLPYDYPYNPEVVEEVWNRAAAYQKDRNVLFTVGYRGKNDYPFWNDVPSFNTSESRGKLISEAILTQKSILESHVNKPKMFTYLWDEMLPLYVEGYFKVPDDVSIVHADNGAGQIFDQNLVEAGHGLYYHVAMESGSQNQLTELCSPSRIYEQLLNFVKKKANSYFILNTSDLRSVPLSTKAAMDFVWNPNPFVSVDPLTAQQKFINNWVANAYETDNSTLIDQITSLYVDYFNVDYMAGTNTPNNVPLGEQWLTTHIRNLLSDIFNWGISGHTGSLPVGSAKSSLKIIENPIKQLNSLSVNAMIPLSKIPENRKQFYLNHLVLQTNMHLHGSNALAAVCNAVLILTNGTPNATDAALRQLNIANEEIDAIISLEHLSETGNFEYWFMWDSLDDWFSLTDAIRNTSLALINVKEDELPIGRFFHGGTGTWSYEFQYEFKQKTYFPLFYPSQYYLDTFVSVTCAPSETNCVVSAIGINFSQTQTEVVLSVLRPGVDIYYTLDGTNPSPSSSKWDGKPIVLTPQWAESSTNPILAAAAYSNGVALNPTTKAVVRYSKN